MIKLCPASKIVFNVISGVMLGAIAVGLLAFYDNRKSLKRTTQFHHEAYSRGCMQTRINTNTNPWSVDFEWSPGPHFHSPKPPPIPNP